MGALVYSARDGNLTVEQYDRLKAELEQGFQGAARAGRPLLGMTNTDVWTLQSFAGIGAEPTNELAYGNDLYTRTAKSLARACFCGVRPCE